MSIVAADTVVVGLGNPLMGDEGIGNHLVTILEERFRKKETIRFIDAGSAEFRILHAIAGKKKAIIIDCAKMKENPGTIRRFTPDDVRNLDMYKQFSLHEGDLLQILKLSRTLGEYPGEVVIFGIEPGDISERETLSSSLQTRLEDYIETVMDETY